MEFFSSVLSVSPEQVIARLHVAHHGRKLLLRLGRLVLFAVVLHPVLPFKLAIEHVLVLVDCLVKALRHLLVTIKRLFGLVKSLKVLLLSQMRVESHQLLSQLAYHLHLVDEDFVEIANVDIYVALRLVDGVEQVHILAGNVHHVIDVLSVALDKLFLFFENHLDQTLVILTDPVGVVAILHLKF